MRRREDVWIGEYLISGTTFDKCYLRTFNTGDMVTYYGHLYKRIMIEDEGQYRVAFIKVKKDKG